MIDLPGTVEPPPELIETPAHLGAAGASLYGSAVDSYDLSIPELAALLQAAETLDTLGILEDSIRETGSRSCLPVQGPAYGQVRSLRAVVCL